MERVRRALHGHNPPTTRPPQPWFVVFMLFLSSSFYVCMYSTSQKFGHTFSFNWIVWTWDQNQPFKSQVVSELMWIHNWTSVSADRPCLIIIPGLLFFTSYFSLKFPLSETFSETGTRLCHSEPIRKLLTILRKTLPSVAASIGEFKDFRDTLKAESKHHVMVTSYHVIANRLFLQDSDDLSGAKFL